MASKCTKCGNTDSYNFALNIGLCDPCIGEKLEQLEEIKEMCLGQIRVIARSRITWKKKVERIVVYVEYYLEG